MSDLIVPATFDQYDKLSDDLLTIGPNVISRFNVSLSRFSDGQRYHFHKEFKYQSNKLGAPSEMITLRRSFDYYITIENLKSVNGVKEYIIIGVNDYIRFKFALEQVSRWFMSNEYKDLYAKKNNKLVMTAHPSPIVLDRLPMDKSITFEATIIEYQNGEMVPAVRLYLSAEDNYTDLTIDKLMGFLYIISTLNMFQCAQEMINYLGRPDYGTNMTSFESDYGFVKSQVIPGRTIPTKKE